ncbi:MAG: SOS response-associated peptidase [Bauldia sp.]|nr:SOS response-associated peptidase [Bauldia sp.]
MVQLFGLTALPQSNFPPRYNIAPTQEIAIVRPPRESDGRELVMARWGLIPFFMKEKPDRPHINARAETVERLPLFREAFARRRCLIPATGFYEWQHDGDRKQPWRFVRKDRDPFAFAGLWETAGLGEEKIRSAAIIVTEANAVVAPLHDRMPVIIPAEVYGRWLDPETTVEEAKAMLRPFPPEFMEAYPVSKRVNSHVNDDEALIEPVEIALAEGAAAADTDLLGTPIQTRRRR